MHNEAHDKFLKCVDDYHGISGERRSLLHEYFYNYRCDKGLRLSISGIDIIKDLSDYKWLEIPLERFIESREFTIIDLGSKSPYYIKDKSLYISDENLIIYWSLSNNLDQFLNMINKKG